MKRPYVWGLILVGGLALLSAWRVPAFHDNVSLWVETRDEDGLVNVRKHINLRDAFRERGDVMGMLHECEILLNGIDADTNHLISERERAMVGTVCFR